MTLQLQAEKLIEWYESNKRDLPWRLSKDPYRVWISETMLQQTTSRAVIPFYEKFLKAFPTVKDLARADEGEVLKNWAGLGYYSRARNLHKAAKIIAAQQTFPSQLEELLALPGYGPYTARAVASIAFSQPTGVVDGNTIRVISRWKNKKIEWWKTAGRKLIQDSMDEWVTFADPGTVNQAMMELGATCCTPTSPTCLLCPIKKGCQGFQKKSDITELPLKKPKKAAEIWSWKPIVATRNGKVALVKNTKLPFLKNQWILPGKGQLKTEKPKTYDYTHTITHHKIYVHVSKSTEIAHEKGIEWVPIQDLKKWCPVSLVDKAIQIEKK